MALCLLLVFSLAMLASTEAHAHVLVTDQSETKGAIIHIMPDDDPIAGQKATLFFDAQNALLDDTSSITLSITRQNTGEAMIIETKRAGSLVTADYIFPSQGAYFVRYSVDSSGHEYVFEQTIRVSRGVALGANDVRRHAWAEGLLIGGGAAFALLGIVAWNRRKDIARQSTF